MHLAEWIKAKGLTLEQFGKLIGRTTPSVSRICNGLQWPDRDTAAAIKRETGGEVDLNPDDFKKLAKREPKDAAAD